MAPKIIAGGEYSGVKADAYSFGGLIYFLVTSKEPAPPEEEDTKGKNEIP
jgi:hypothetical protein